MREEYQANERQLAKALAEKANEAFGARPSDENIQRIAKEATLYELVRRIPGKKRRDADAQVAKFAKSLRAALEHSAKYHATFSVVLGPECERALANLEQMARGLAEKRPKQLRVAQLCRLCDVVLYAYWEVNRAKIGNLGHAYPVEFGTHYILC